MSEATEATPVQETPTVDTPIQAAAKKLTIKELLANLGKEGAPQILKQRPVTLYMPSGDQVEMSVKELTKSQYDMLMQRTTRDMPKVPMVDQHYTMARRDPLTGQVKPAGVYQEPNPTDPTYIAQTQSWFNDCAMQFAMFSSAEDFGLDLTLPEPQLSEHLDSVVATTCNAFPAPTLLDIAFHAATVNRGIPLAEQLLSAVETHQALNELDTLQNTKAALDAEFKVEPNV